jgi:hypothetical protein
MSEHESGGRREILCIYMCDVGIERHLMISYIAMEYPIFLPLQPAANLLFRSSLQQGSRTVQTEFLIDATAITDIFQFRTRGAILS